jgi:hypothetical protein
MLIPSATTFHSHYAVRKRTLGNRVALRLAGDSLNLVHTERPHCGVFGFNALLFGRRV